MSFSPEGPFRLFNMLISTSNIQQRDNLQHFPDLFDWRGLFCEDHVIIISKNCEDKSLTLFYERQGSTEWEKQRAVEGLRKE